ncbi:hypothetical protein PCANC_04875 [Puccinia coronata f. sp. avenae]|uniref:Reverse transcriptase Ty1/copia-type domain-containing protein n=1 Tax=Puccinia coronata f. sp. avenae TaxID=200324 RepID=A0A2N5W2I6_9BASI|nr:hypothetical protein PCANC_04875 [Puccinia coronata f. sp. avenae]
MDSGDFYQGFASRTTSSNYALNVREASLELDYHILLGHPSDKYLKILFQLHQIKPTNPQQTARNCKVCIQCKIKRTPHNNPLLTANRPFKTLHMDVLQISPPSKTSLKYILVIIDDYSCFNQIYLMKNKSKSESKILLYINEIVNKMALDWSSPVIVLSELNVLIEPVRDINNMIPFGLKVFVSHKSPSKPSNLVFPYNSPNAITKPLGTLPTAVLETIKSSQKSSRDMPSIRITPVKSMVKSSGQSVPPPNRSPTPDDHCHRSTMPSGPVPSHVSTPLPSPPPPPSTAKGVVSVTTPRGNVGQRRPMLHRSPRPILSATTGFSGSKTAATLAKNWTYVPDTTRPSKEISSTINPKHIVQGSRQANAQQRQPDPIPPAVEDPPEALMLLQFDLPKYVFLTETVTVKKAMNNAAKRRGWEEAMEKEFHSLDNKNTGTLVPPPGGDKVIGGMWLLTHKKNKFGDLLCYKARWVRFGNHQVHMLHYFDTYAVVAQNELFKLLISVAVNCWWAVFQFDVKTVFLYGKINVPVYVSQVESFEQPGKESWVWRLNKLLYGTKQAPGQWRKHLVNTLTKLSFDSSPLDESLFYSPVQSQFIHMHVDKVF